MTLNKTNYDWLFDMSVKRPHGRTLANESGHLFQTFSCQSEGLAMQDYPTHDDSLIDPFNVCKHRKPRLGARAAWGQKNGAANRPAYCVKEKQTSLIDR